MSVLQSQAEGVTQVLASPGSAEVQGELPVIAASKLIPPPLLRATANLAVKGAIGSGGTQSSFIVQRIHAVSFTLHENGFISSHSSTHRTVGQALAGLGIRLRSYDSVSPDPGSDLLPGQHIYVRYASSVRFVHAGEEQTLYTRADTVGEMLARAGITLEPQDRLRPRAGAPVREGMTVQLVTVRDEPRVEEEPLEFYTVYVYDADLPKGERQLVQAGSDGGHRREYRVRLVDGREIRRELVSESITEPTEQIIAIGTYVPPTPAPAPAPAPRPVVSGPTGECSRTLTVYATWYTAASAGGSGRTATGTAVYKGIVAVDPLIIPLGTRMYIPGYGPGLAADTGGGIKGYKIDLGYGPTDVYDWRTGWVDICIY